MKYLEGQQEQEAIKLIEKAADVAKKGLCLRAKCGAVIVKYGEIIGEGYNAPPLNSEEHRTCLNEYQLPQKFKYDRTCCMHAEWRAIIDALKHKPEKLDGSRLYFTRINEEVVKWGKPFCTVCSRIILDVGIAEVILTQQKGLCLYSADEYNKLSHQYKDEEK
ncbi:MAG: hypothetical protein COV41_01110 [Candidatus Brennerbacteria bacterium CG11_big_fil_rev_8_21_14_0_20_43_10]|uniref:CMP/dCMP-type deaminase domain-containing protein n=3 Tax=Candidatus Brenneribacteriota TaxID=1817902 RepID=A0A2M8C2Z0_9BACT|nr:MAG: hypothetical protein AUJ43_01230 [Parcubacteria group bacterium CG1_02_44_31]PIP50526.1 MAG: hypothetical protein COX12_00915 [Candidatus Brennerbacteria bacterium CG23_combo_of_CG06-09_8_20_14_all_44_41]PIR26612.1 MAG: hypothetical protein COV41_01110 [Candidatus Brennerbacteria bacterium CG11_big_fil_rev_8_21_14_0_20_43_10]PIX29115.1 MAG: hypothetical protein COZ64_00945 [Candidatus Brennerbacteria bacterium CG_4_8_14_3_um_filter_43_14]PJA19795.1 MAG: hypothetical protein COX61_00270 